MALKRSAVSNNIYINPKNKQRASKIYLKSTCKEFRKIRFKLQNKAYKIYGTYFYQNDDKYKYIYLTAIPQCP